MPQFHLCVAPVKRRRPPRSGSLYIPAFHLAHGDGRHQAIAEVGRRLTHNAASKHSVSLHLSTGKRRVRADEAGAELDRTAISDSVLRPAPDQNQKTDRRQIHLSHVAPSASPSVATAVYHNSRTSTELSVRQRQTREAPLPKEFPPEANHHRHQMAKATLTNDLAASSCGLRRPRPKVSRGPF